jgi:uroporphyrinogen decarboxylase
MTMNSRERVLAAIRREQPDRVPFDFNFGISPVQHATLKRLTGFDDPQEYFQTDRRSVGDGPSRQCADFSRYFKDLPARARIDEWGIASVPTDSDDPRHAHLEGFIYPMRGLSTVAELNEYPFPDVEAQYRYEHLPKQVAEHHARGLCCVGELMATIFEIAWWMRSMEELMIDFVDNPDFAMTLLDCITDKRCIQARYLVECGVDYLHLADDISGQRGMLMSMPMWRKWLKPRLARVIDAAKSVNPNIPIAYHTDGNPTAAIPDLIEIGVDLWDPVQPECVDPKVMKQMFGEHLSFFGCIGTQTLLPFGTPDDIRRTVRDLVETVGKGGGLILAPTHMVEPEVPWENIVAFVDAVKEYDS